MKQEHINLVYVETACGGIWSHPLLHVALCEKDVPPRQIETRDGRRWRFQGWLIGGLLRGQPIGFRDSNDDLWDNCCGEDEAVVHAEAIRYAPAEPDGAASDDQVLPIEEAARLTT